MTKYEGTHEEGLGWTPMGDFCGECSRRTCQGCPVAEEEDARIRAMCEAAEKDSMQLSKEMSMFERACGISYDYENEEGGL